MAAEVAVGFGGKQDPTRDRGDSQVLLQPVWLAMSSLVFPSSYLPGSTFISWAESQRSRETWKQCWWRAQCI